jgi:hypothetical protein
MKDRNEQADLFGICLTGVDEPEVEGKIERPAPRREEDRPQQPPRTPR